MRLLRVLLVILLINVALSYAVRMPMYTGREEFAVDFEVDSDRLERHVRVLSEELVPRTCENPEALESAANYIRDEFTQWNPDTSFQTYQLGDQTTANVVSSFGPDTKEIIVVGAHYDAFLNMPGADDNASGVAGLLELGRALSTVELNKKVQLVAYACEEPPYFSGPLMGSYVHANSLTTSDVKLMISLEMIGYFTQQPESQDFPVPYLSVLYPDRGNYIAVVGDMFSMEASRLKQSINKYTDLNAYSINAPASLPGVDFSDHRNYWELDIPAIMVTDTAFYRNKRYHTPQDTYDTLDYGNMKEVVFGVFAYVVDL